MPFLRTKIRRFRICRRPHFYAVEDLYFVDDDSILVTARKRRNSCVASCAGPARYVLWLLLTLFKISY